MTRFAVLPDAEAVVSIAIRAAAITGLDDRVYSSVPKSPVYPLVVIERLGGAPAVRRYLDGPLIQVTTWGSAKDDDPATRVSKGDIHDIAQQVRVVLMQMEGTTVASVENVFVAGVADASGMLWLPDATSARDRYVFSVYLYCRATA